MVNKGKHRNPWLKLDLNESPYGKVGYSRMKDYEDARKKIAHYTGVKVENIALTNGSSHALEIIFSFLFHDKDIVLLPIPNFVFYTVFEKNKHLRFVKIPYQNKWSIEKLTKKLEKGIKGVYISNPNNPIGYLFSVKELTALITKAAKYKTLVIIDEAYFEFSQLTFKGLIKRFPNLIILRSLSKAFGLAGLRIGYIISNHTIIKTIEELTKKPLTITRPGLKAINDLTPDDFRTISLQVYKINKAREKLISFLERGNIKYYPSSANFLTIKTKNSKLIADKLKNNKILVADLNNYPDGAAILKNCIRITIPRFSDLPRLKRAIN